jgi:hypothetical protein
MILPQGMSEERTRAVHALFQRMIADAITREGITLIPLARTHQISDQLVQDLGGVFDPKTGRAHEEKFGVFLEYFRREVNDQLKADAVVMAVIVPGKAPYSGAEARWHGTSQTIGAAASFSAFSGRAEGTVPVISLSVVIDDALTGARLWSGLGGISVLSKREAGKWITIPLEEALGDPERNRAAVGIAFQLLVRGG